MRKILLLMLVVASLFSCGKTRENTPYRVETIAGDIAWFTVISNEEPTGLGIFPTTSSTTELSHEWLGTKINKIEIRLTHDETLGPGEIRLYRAGKLIGKASGYSPTLLVDTSKK